MPESIQVIGKDNSGGKDNSSSGGWLAGLERACAWLERVCEPSRGAGAGTETIAVNRSGSGS